MIKSVSHSQIQILKWIKELYCPHGIDVDPTYGHGGFYTTQDSLFGENVLRPLFYSDMHRSTHGAWRVDARCLPIKTASVKSVIIDPPFLAGGGKGGIMAEKYGVAGDDNDPSQIWDLYKACIDEAYRILRKFGHLIVKCQDVMHGRTNYMTSIEIVNYCISKGMYPKDTFIFISKTRPKAWNHTRQNYSRKHHSYFFVFGKQVRTVGYSNEPDRKDRYHWVTKPKQYKMIRCPICGIKRKFDGLKVYEVPTECEIDGKFLTRGVRICKTHKIRILINGKHWQEYPEEDTKGQSPR